jgi:hypothetical protein
MWKCTIISRKVGYAARTPAEAYSIPASISDAVRDHSTVVRRTSATDLAASPLSAQQFLLPYAIRPAAAASMLYGGTRTSGLRMVPPPLAVTHSARMRLPTRAEERADLQMVDHGADVQLHLVPSNMHLQLRHAAARTKNVDLARRHGAIPDTISPPTATHIATRGARVAGFHPPPTELRVEPMAPDQWRALPERYQRFTPLQCLKPHGGATAYGGGGVGDEGETSTGQVWSAALRGVRSKRPATAELYQERLNRRGFGHKALQRKMWQQDINTQGYEPDRGY